MVFFNQLINTMYNLAMSSYQRTKNIIKSILSRVKVIRYRTHKIKQPLDIVRVHFSTWSTMDHPNKKAFETVVQELNGKPAKIIETGTSAWGTDSTRLWDKYVSTYGGSFYSVDIRSEPAIRLKGHLGKKSKLIVNDSVVFLEDTLNSLEGSANVYFLDSWDVDWAAPLSSASHGLREYFAIKPNLVAGILLFIDDTPVDLLGIPKEFHEVAKKFRDTHGVLPGKGAFILKEIERNMSFKVLHHSYSVVIQFT